MEANIKHLLENKALKWIFVGGKGGVGKTTCSCSIAVQMAKVRKDVLIISTDPAHNISDAFDQKFGKTPTKVNGFANLFAMEIDPTIGFSQLPDDFLEQNSSTDNLFSSSKEALKELVSSLPGIDEAMSFAEVIRLVQGYNYSLVIFDTAPTGHTLRLVALPTLIEESIEKLLGMTSQITPIFNQFSSLLNMAPNSLDGIIQKIRQTQDVVKRISSDLHDPNLCTFVCVCISEFLSLYETERLVQQLTKLNIEVDTIIVNQLVSSNEPSFKDCTLCCSRFKIQKKYYDQIIELYDDFHVIPLPLLPEEVRGSEKLKVFSQNLVNKISNKL